jgi:hypothetical protein
MFEAMDFDYVCKHGVVFGAWRPIRSATSIFLSAIFLVEKPEQEDGGQENNLLREVDDF